MMLDLLMIVLFDSRQRSILRVADELRAAYRARWRLLKIAEERGVDVAGRYHPDPSWEAYQRSVTLVCRLSEQLNQLAAAEHYAGPRI